MIKSEYFHARCKDWFPLAGFYSTIWNEIFGRAELKCQHASRRHKFRRFMNLQIRIGLLMVVLCSIVYPTELNKLEEFT